LKSATAFFSRNGQRDFTGLQAENTGRSRPDLSVKWIVRLSANIGDGFGFFQ